ncbi:MAG: 23S rRNA (pseudouridine(1915)-N(3))-methyltransferase RlmH [Flavobacteriaceae bacterium]|jgi:23S rRNA (pseudouridine1915-N3)-methyltransferase|nr:23S rRNA (pseudouridine(1915)-N(3))-methyltransferase RlmH [Flavobacteriaceae bacterium]MBT6128094.1 23S rRNA (pseudouridine(1915)-N(3))-methyltransferase RlmH [Flavobacteriaceae bacterium]
MHTLLVLVGKTNDSRMISLMEDYTKRINRYHRLDIQVVPELKNKGKMSEKIQKQKEGALILEKLKAGDWVILLDEKGKTFDSIGFSQYINTRRSGSHKRMVFIVGGPYGFSEEMYARGQEKITLSSMTFSHQMIRVFFLEQLYRANTLLNNEPYHHK